MTPACAYVVISNDRGHQVGLAHARKTVQVTPGPDTYRIAVEPCTTITAPRTTSLDIKRHKASNYKRG